LITAKMRRTGHSSYLISRDRGAPEVADSGGPPAMGRWAGGASPPLLHPPGKGWLWGWTPSQNLQLPSCDSPGGSTDQRFRVLPNYFGHLFLLVWAIVGYNACVGLCVQGKLMMLKTVAQYMPLKATMREIDIPGLSSADITFYGIVSSQDYRSIIVNATVFSHCCR